MRVAVPHNTTKERARQIVEQRFAELTRQYGSHAEDVDHAWIGDILEVKLKARGFSIKGTVEITDQVVIVDGKLPLLAMPFESGIRATLQREAEAMFRTA